MARQAGLTPFADDRPDIERAPEGRQRLRDPGPDRMPELRPAAYPVETFTRPARYQDDSLDRISQSLAALNPALLNFGETFKQDREDDLKARIAKNYQGLSGPEMVKKMANDPDAQARMGQQLIGKYQARSVAEQVARDAASTLVTADKDSFDEQAYLKALREKALKENAGNPFFAQEFDNSFNPMAAGAKAKMAEHRAQRELDRRADTIQDGWLGTVDKGLKAGDTPEQIIAAIRGSYDANKGALKIGYGEQDEKIVGLVGALREKMESDPANAERYFKIAQGLVNGDRTGSDGTKLGTILGSSTLGPKAAAALGAVERSYGQIRDRGTADEKYQLTVNADNGILDEGALKRFYEDPSNKGAMTENEYRSLRLRNQRARDTQAEALRKAQAEYAERQQTNSLEDQALDQGDKGTLWKVQPTTIQGANGKPKEVSADDQISGAVKKFLERDQYQTARELAAFHENEAARPAGKRMSEEDIQKVVEQRSFARRVEWFASNGQDNPEWKDVMKRGALAGLSTVQGDTIPPTMLEGFRTYQRLAAAAPNMAHKLADENARSTFDVARTLVESGAMDEGRALQAAVEYQRDPSRFDSLTARQRVDQIQSQLKSMQGNGLSRLLGWGNMPHAERMEDVSTDVQKLAKTYVTVGKMNVEDALKEAGKVVARNYTVINGTAVRTGDRRVPPNFADNAQQFLKKFADEHKEDPSGLTLRPLPNSATSWVVINKSGVPAAPGGKGVMSLDDLRAADDERVAQERLKTEMAARAKKQFDETRGKTWNRLGETNPVTGGTGLQDDTPTFKKPSDIPPPKTDTPALRLTVEPDGKPR